MSPNWPFHEPQNLAVFTSRQILDEHHPILLVTHDAEDAEWQFHSGDAVEESDARIILLAEALEIDPTIAELFDLPVGWRACRATPSSPWERERI